jgi:hypothetical protein
MGDIRVGYLRDVCSFRGFKQLICEVITSAGREVVEVLTGLPAHQKTSHFSKPYTYKNINNVQHEQPYMAVCGLM